MEAVMRRSERPVRCKAPHFLFRRRGLAAQETTAPDLQKPAFREPHLSGQPGGRHVNVLPDKPEAKAGGLRERVRPGAKKTKNTSKPENF